MINKIKLIGLFILFVLMSGLYIQECIKRQHVDGLNIAQMEQFELERNYLISKYDSCLLSKSTIDTIRDTIFKYLGYKYIKKELTAVDSIKIHEYFLLSDDGTDTVDIYEKEYDGILESEDFELVWYARVFGELEELSFPHYRVYKEKIIENWVINNPAPPSEEKIEYKYRRGIYLEGSLGNSMESWKSWESIDGGIGYLTRRGISFGINYEYFVFKDIRGQFLRLRLRYYLGK
jgi:hypothetical protein